MPEPLRGVANVAVTVAGPLLIPVATHVWASQLPPRHALAPVAGLYALPFESDTEIDPVLLQTAKTTIVLPAAFGGENVALTVLPDVDFAAVVWTKLGAAAASAVSIESDVTLEER